MGRRTVFGREKNEFVSIWDTRIIGSGTTPNNQIKLPLLTYPCYVDWGDGMRSTLTSDTDAAKTHTYSSGGIYTITITGSKRFTFHNENLGDNIKLLEVKSFGLIDQGVMFYNCANLDLANLNSVPRFGTATDLNSLFFGCTNLTKIGTLSQWDFSQVTKVVGMFDGCVKFNQDISITGPITDCSRMFRNCTAFNGNVTLNTSATTSFGNMFQNAKVFNKPVNFNTSSATNMEFMFDGAELFNQPLNFNTPNVTSFLCFLRNAKAFNQSINFNGAKVTNMQQMFLNCVSFNSPITISNTSNVTDMRLLFSGCTVFNQYVNFDMTKVTDAGSMFSANKAFSYPTAHLIVNKDVLLESFMINANTAYEPTYYDAVLQKLQQVAIGTGRTQTNKKLNVAGKYTSAGASARAALIADGWTITDNGQVAS